MLPARHAVRAWGRRSVDAVRAGRRLPKALDEIGKVYGWPAGGSARSSPRLCPSSATRPAPRSSATIST